MKNFILLFSFFAFNNTMLFAQTQGEMNFQASNSYTKVDKELGVVYQQILKKYSKNTKFINYLRISQRLWIQFRDAEVKMMYPADDARMAYGSMYPLLHFSLLEELTKTRIKDLKVWINPKEQDIQGSVGDYEGVY
jgi:uncharacterized protein YecT (DUF1311 family)